MAEKRERRKIKRPRPEKKPAPRDCPPRWAWFFGGLLIGIFASFLFYLYEIAPRNLAIPIQSTPTTTISDNGENPEAALNYEDYEFYNNLPKTEVKVVETVDNATDQNAQTINALQATDSSFRSNLRLQVGSFRDAKTAQGLKKHLSSLNIEANIEQAVVNGLSWHRVRVGPFSSELALEQMKARLEQQKIAFSVVE